MKLEKHSADKHSETSAEVGVHKDRREFLEKCGRFAAYTTPAVLLLLHSKKADAIAVS